MSFCVFWDSLRAFEPKRKAGTFQFYMRIHIYGVHTRDVRIDVLAESTVVSTNDLSESIFCINLFGSVRPHVHSFQRIHMYVVRLTNAGGPVGARETSSLRCSGSRSLSPGARVARARATATVTATRSFSRLSAPPAARRLSRRRWVVWGLFRWPCFEACRRIGEQKAWTGRETEVGAIEA